MMRSSQQTQPEPCTKPLHILSIPASDSGLQAGASADVFLYFTLLFSQPRAKNTSENIQPLFYIWTELHNSNRNYIAGMNMNYDVTIAFLTIGVFSLAIAVIHPPEQKTYTITGDGFYSYLEENGAIGVMEAYKVGEYLAPMGKSIAGRYDIPGGSTLPSRKPSAGHTSSLTYTTAVVRSPQSDATTGSGRYTSAPRASALQKPAQKQYRANTSRPSTR
ncbi:hypothetical protein P8X34_10405 [Pyrococcus kukulkanii]|uniref:Uncharacterized protein n=1 Tax=Pyrococcus kukulkanii TaxID=1609559 RepID=A0ABV4T627_9EURY